MIIYPKNWAKIGQPIKLKEIENTILQILSEIKCRYLSLSGGLDSSLMLYFMLRIYPQVEAFTIGGSEDHPDIRFSRAIIRNFENRTNLIKHRVYIPTPKEKENEKRIGDFKGDNAVRLFYKFVSRYTDQIIACDGIDEFMCGYYDHQDKLCEDTYYAYLRQLRNKHLIPLDKNSNQVKVYLPYLDDRLLLLFSQIPISEKVDKDCRKKLMVEMAKGKIPNEIINRRKYGFCDVLRIKED